jgi:hypothetical protein
MLPLIITGESESGKSSNLDDSKTGPVAIDFLSNISVCRLSEGRVFSYAYRLPSLFRFGLLETHVVYEEGGDG